MLELKLLYPRLDLELRSLADFGREASSIRKINSGSLISPISLIRYGVSRELQHSLYIPCFCCPSFLGFYNLLGSKVINCSSMGFQEPLCGLTMSGAPDA